MTSETSVSAYGCSKPRTWREVLSEPGPLLLPAAYDALCARVYERAGLRAYQIGGFAFSGSRFGYPDIDLIHYGEIAAGVRDIVAASTLPALVDVDDGYGDAKNVTRTVQGYERIGASALFIEDQVAPKRCGHMGGKSVVPTEVMEAKLRAAVAARRDPETFLIARTDALEPLGVDEALRRAERYLKCGVDGIYVEEPHTVEELETIGKAFRGVPQVANMLEGGGRTPWVSPTDLHDMGFAMILFPTTVLFQATKAIENAVARLQEGRPMPEDVGVSFDHYEEILDLPGWRKIEATFGSEHGRRPN